MPDGRLTNRHAQTPRIVMRGVCACLHSMIVIYPYKISCFQ